MEKKEEQFLQIESQHKSKKNHLNQITTNLHVQSKRLRKDELQQEGENNQIESKHDKIDIVQSKQEAFLASEGAQYFQNSLETQQQAKQREQKALKLKNEEFRNMYKNLLVVSYFTQKVKDSLQKKVNEKIENVNIEKQQQQFSIIMAQAQKKAQNDIIKLQLQLLQKQRKIDYQFVKEAYRVEMEKIQKIKEQQEKEEKQMAQKQRKFNQKNKHKQTTENNQQQQIFLQPNLNQPQGKEQLQRPNFQTFGYREQLIRQDTISLETLTTLANTCSKEIKSKWNEMVTKFKQKKMQFSFSSFIRWGGQMLDSVKNNVLALKNWIVQTGSSILNMITNPGKKLQSIKFTDQALLTFFFNILWQAARNGYFRKFKIEYKKDAKVIDYKIRPGAKIGIIGDYGTGLKDSILLMKDMVQQRGVDVIIHLGDVYYAGGQHEYKRGITDPLNNIRKKLKQKYKQKQKQKDKQVLFYSIPGNHDYYSGGKTFLDFIDNINKHQSIDPKTRDSKKQDASFFCLRDQQEKWQFLGMDTAYSQTQAVLSQLVAQKNPAHSGPDIIPTQLQWHKKRIDEFKGSTILLSHHQLFSIHDRISGQFTKLRQFSNINPKLITRMFSYYPFTSCWFWGHQHSIMFFEDNILGLQKGRLLGNSSFHVNSNKYDPYSIHQGFPQIKIKKDWIHENTKKSIIPSSKSKSKFYDFSYAVIQMPAYDPNDMKKYQQSDLDIKYYCTPCFLDQEQNSKGQKFPPYLLYSQKISPFKKIHQKKHIFSHKATEDVFLLTQLGLFVNLDKTSQLDDNLKLNLEGVPIKIQFLGYIQDTQNQNPRVKVHIKAETNKGTYFLSCNNKEDRVNFVQESGMKKQSKFQVWQIWFNFNQMKRSYPNRNDISKCGQEKDVKLYDSFWLYNVGKKKFLQLDSKKNESQTFILRGGENYKPEIMNQIGKRQPFMKDTTFIFMLVELSPDQRISISKPMSK